MPKKASKKASEKPARVTSKAAGKPIDAASASRKIDGLIAKLGDWRGARLAEIRKLVHEVDPGVVEGWKWMGTPVWSHAGIYALANPHKDKVKLTFWHGARLRDPAKLFNAGLDGNQWRAIDLRETDELDQRALAALLREALAYDERNAESKGKARSGRAAAKAAQPRKAAAKPRLLSGGNPQIAKADGDAPVQAYIAAMPGWKREVGRRIDALIERNVPDVRKAVRWNTPFYGIEGQGWFLSFHCLTNYLKVGFFRGKSLEPLPPGGSKQGDVRYLDIREDEPLDEARFAAWVKQASRLPGWGTV